MKKFREKALNEWIMRISKGEELRAAQTIFFLLQVPNRWRPILDARLDAIGDKPVTFETYLKLARQIITESKELTQRTEEKKGSGPGDSQEEKPPGPDGV